MKTRVTLEHEIRWPRRVLTAVEAVKYVDATGFCTLCPVAKVPLPSLYFAVTRRNPHEKMIWDKYSALVWRWKDELPARRRLFYGKYFRGRGSLISLHFLPSFLSLEAAAIEPGDHELFYSNGRIQEDARTIWKALEEQGPLATLDLRYACGMDSKAGNVRFKRAMLDLQRRLIVVHFGSEQETAAWASGRYELTCRAFPDQTAQARRISPDQARAVVAAKYLEWHKKATARQIARLFSWSKIETERALLPEGTPNFVKRK